MSNDKDSKNEIMIDDSSKIIKVSDSTSIVISKNIWKNQERLDIRTYLKTENYSGPTKKGINIPIEKLDEIISALNEIKDQN